MERSYRFRIYPNAERQVLLAKPFGCVRFVYNHYLAKRIDAYQSDKPTLNYYACASDLTQLRKEYDWLREADSTALQFALKHRELAYQNFFRRAKQCKNPGFQRFKSRHDNRRSCAAEMNAKDFGDAVRLPKLGLTECRVSRQVCCRILSANASQVPSGKYFAPLCCCGVGTEKLAKSTRNLVRLQRCRPESQGQQGSRRGESQTGKSA